MKKFFIELFNVAWFWFPIMIVILLFTSYCYYKSHYCKEIPCVRIGKDCVRSHTEDNGMTGKYHREYWVCDEYVEYLYNSTRDSCGCTKIK